MGLRPATPHELESVRAAVDEFRVRWASIPSIFPCSFSGTGDDISLEPDDIPRVLGPSKASSLSSRVLSSTP